VPRKTRERGKEFAVAVRDNDALRLFLSLKRVSSGDVYVDRLIDDDDGKRNSHASYHASGLMHHKSYNKASIRRMRQKPDAAFTGTEWVDGSPISLQGARILDKVCHLEEYAGVFEIDASDISPTYENCWTSIMIDLLAPGESPIPSGFELRRMIIRDRVPYISITLCTTLLRLSRDDRNPTQGATRTS
jgi:hypothetical protein